MTDIKFYIGDSEDYIRIVDDPNSTKVLVGVVLPDCATRVAVDTRQLYALGHWMMIEAEKRKNSS